MGASSRHHMKRVRRAVALSTAVRSSARLVQIGADPDLVDARRRRGARAGLGADDHSRGPLRMKPPGGVSGRRRSPGSPPKRLSKGLFSLTVIANINLSPEIHCRIPEQRCNMLGTSNRPLPGATLPSAVRVAAPAGARSACAARVPAVAPFARATSARRMRRVRETCMGERSAPAGVSARPDDRTVRSLANSVRQSCRPGIGEGSK